MAHRDKEWVADILFAIADIRADTAGMDFAAFAADPSTVRAVLYSISVIGEAAKNVSPAFKEAYPGVPWRAVAGTRDRVVHEYFRTNFAANLGRGRGRHQRARGGIEETRVTSGRPSRCLHKISEKRLQNSI
jgi:uncharacterized protein with HEPN domain